MSSAKGDVIMGNFKGLVDGYINKYDDEEESFKGADAAMQKVVDAAASQQAKARAVDERQKLQGQHEETLSAFAGFIRTLDGAVKALRPGHEDWMEGFPEVSGKVAKIYEAYPVFLAKETNVKGGP